jgi:hypothetical protein
MDERASRDPRALSPRKKASGDPSQTWGRKKRGPVAKHVWLATAAAGRIHAKRGARFFDERSAPNRKISVPSLPLRLRSA